MSGTVESVTIIDMRRRLFLAAAIVFVLAVSACSDMGNSTTTHGSGNVKTESRDVSDFSAVDLTGIGDVMIKQTGTETLTIAAEDNILPLLTSTVSDGTLTLGTKPGSNIDPTKPIQYTLTVKNLDALTISGSGTITDSDVDTDSFTATLSGSGTITVAGTTHTQAFVISGSGTYTADGLASSTARAQISGSGNASISVDDNLDVTITGSGTVTYTGDPRLTQQITGSGSIVKG
jgi:Putative auto-transporter adhesin, head GIN domain